MTEPLKRLKELTETLHIVPLKSIAAITDNRVHYDCEQGSCYGHNLYNDGAIAIQYAQMEEGTVMKPHTHIDNREYIIVISGHFQSEAEGKVSEARDGEMVVVDPGTTHIASAPVLTKLIGITIPASEGYPHG